MNWIDIASLVIILSFALVGLYRGFLRSVFRVVAWLVGIAGAYFSHLFLSDFVIENFDVSSLAVKPICLIIGFVVPFTLAQLAGHFLHTAVSHTIISKPNRLFGACFGALKGAIVCFILLTVIHFLPLKDGKFNDMRNEAVAYDTYKSSLEFMGYPTGRKEIIKKAEKKAEAITSGIAEKVTDKAKDGAEQIADKAKEAAVDAAGKAIDKISENATQAVLAKDKATESVASKVDSVKTKSSASKL